MTIYKKPIIWTVRKVFQTLDTLWLASSFNVKLSCQSWTHGICCYMATLCSGRICSFFHQMIMLFSGFVSEKIMFPRSEKFDLREARGMILGRVPWTTSVGLHVECKNSVCAEYSACAGRFCGLSIERYSKHTQIYTFMLRYNWMSQFSGHKQRISMHALCLEWRATETKN